jgi:hypothetical protein
MKRKHDDDDEDPYAGNWYVKDGSKNYGPLTWAQLTTKVYDKGLSNKAWLFKEGDKNGVPAGMYFPGGQLVDAEVSGLIPSRYDAMFYLGLIIFIVSIVIFIGMPVVGLVLAILSTAIEIGAIYFEHKNRPGSITGSIGKILALLWIGFQVLVLLGLVAFIFL